MCERILAQLASMTAGEREQLRRNCARAIQRSGDLLITQEARRVLDELAAMERREAAFLARNTPARQIEYAFRRRPADLRERKLISALQTGSLRLSPAPLAAIDVAEARRGASGQPAWVPQLEAMCSARRHLLPVAEDCIAEGLEGTHPRCGEHCALAYAEAASGCVRLSADAAQAFARIGYLDPQVASAEPSSGNGMPMAMVISLAASSHSGTPAE